MGLIHDIESMGLIAPGEDTIMRMISKIRNSAPNPLDKPWSIGSLSRYDFPAETIPILIEVRKLQMQTKIDEAPKECFTIRHAQWIARLYRLITEIYIRKYRVALDELRRPVNKEYLWMVWVIADVYAKWEKMSEIIGQAADTPRFDTEFFITESFWDLPTDQMADHYKLVLVLYDCILKDCGDGRVKHKTDHHIPSAEPG